MADAQQTGSALGSSGAAGSATLIAHYQHLAPQKQEGDEDEDLREPLINVREVFPICSGSPEI